MTERLSSLMHEEAETLDIPHPRAAEAMAQGRKMQLRHRITNSVVALAVAAAVGVGLTTLPNGDGDGENRDAGIAGTRQSAYEHWGAWSDGKAVYVGNERTAIGSLIKVMYYTSEGVLVRTGESLASDGGGPSTFTLVHPDGTKVPVPVTIGETVPATSFDEPYLAYSQPNGDAFDLVLYDLASGKEEARTTLHETMKDLGWPSPPVALGDGVVWALTDDGWKQWNFETGEVSDAPTDIKYLVGFDNDHYATVHGDRWQVQGMTDDSVLAYGTVGGDAEGGADLSPDGQFITVTTYDDKTFEQDVKIFDVATGEQFTLPARSMFSWTPGGRMLVTDVDADGRLRSIRSCDVRTGDCETSSWTPSGDDTRLAGLAYES